MVGSCCFPTTSSDESASANPPELPPPNERGEFHDLTFQRSLTTRLPQDICNGGRSNGHFEQRCIGNVCLAGRHDSDRPRRLRWPWNGAAGNALSVDNGPIKLIAMADVFEKNLTASHGNLSKDSNNANARWTSPKNVASSASTATRRPWIA